ncbi:MAG: hypothetical protein GXP55_12900 [Deltaproteobacteria bacterium]|nr:hypothetical protein [Deltaproteobacteria bacterium]
MLLLDILGYASSSRFARNPYQEATGEWQSLPSLSVGRFDHSAVQLDDGRVLVAAGYINDLTAFHGADQSEITSVPLL